MKWYEDRTYFFVQQYIKQDCLINANHPLHGNKAVRKAALQTLVNAMGLPDFGIKECISKIRAIRSTYSQEARKIKNSVNKAELDDNVPIHVPTLKWFKIYDDKIQEINGTAPYIREEYLENESASSCGSEAEQDDVKDMMFISMSDNNDEEAALQSPKEDKFSKYIRKRPHRQFNGVSKRVKIERENEFDIFGQCVAAQLKRMPQIAALKAQAYIQNYICNLRIEHLTSSADNEHNYS